MSNWKSRLQTRLFALLVFATAWQPAGAQADTTSASLDLFTYRDAALGAAVLVGALFARRLDERASLRIQDSSTQANARLHQISGIVRTTAAPGALIIGTSMYAVGRLTREEHLAALGLHGTEALIVGELVGGVMKGFIGRQRPYVKPQNSHSYGFLRGFGGGDPYRSLPSGHTLAAFAAASAVSSETAGWWPGTRWVIAPVLFTGAALTGLSRMYDNRHWASDVIVGAGIGTFAGLKVVRYSNTHSGNRVDKLLLTGSIVPLSEGGHAFHWSILPGFSLPSGPRAH
ncbi:MAG: phosphatase PAP2 family protein [Gemmatimonadota bacterium]|nr:phosphatase PAP2 family protein [Gemmatimonadota bacterium]